jgi:hypothetical protein
MLSHPGVWVKNWEEMQPDPANRPIASAYKARVCSSIACTEKVAKRPFSPGGSHGCALGRILQRSPQGCCQGIGIVGGHNPSGLTILIDIRSACAQFSADQGQAARRGLQLDNPRYSARLVEGRTKILAAW